MTKSNKIHLAVLSIIDLVAIGNLVNIAWEGNDKAIILELIGFLSLMLLNGSIWLILAIIKRPESKIYKTSTIGLAILFIPTLFISILS